MPTTYANRGKEAEELIELVNGRYLARGIAQIHKVPTAWLPIRNRYGKIVSAKVDKPAAVDFLGNHLGRAIAFDVKSTRNKQRWSLNEISQHQVEYLENEHKINGTAFIILFFWETEEIFVIPFPYLKKKWEGRKGGTGKASISRDELLQHFDPVRPENPNYLARVEEGFYRKAM